MKLSISPPRRYPSGEIVKEQQKPRETDAEKLALALWQRSKLGATQDNFLDQRWGDPLGLMRLWATEAFESSEGLSQMQFDAVKLYCVGLGRSRWAQGYEVRTPRCVGFDMVSTGSYPSSFEPDEETIAELRAAHNSARSALLEYQGRGVAWLRLLDQIGNSERDKPEDEPYWRSMLGEVRSAANVLARHYGMLK